MQTGNKLPETLNGGDVVAAGHDFRRPDPYWIDVVVKAPHMCHATNDPERVYVVGLNHKLGSTEWGQGLYDRTFEEAKAIVQNRHGWIIVLDDPNA
jgi:hypothetical protein